MSKMKVRIACCFLTGWTIAFVVMLILSIVQYHSFIGRYLMDQLQNIAINCICVMSVFIIVGVVIAAVFAV